MFHAAVVDRKLRESKHAEAGLESQLRLLTAVDQTALHEVALVHDDGVEEAQRRRAAAVLVRLDAQQPAHHQLQRQHLHASSSTSLRHNSQPRDARHGSWSMYC